MKAYSPGGGRAGRGWLVLMHVDEPNIHIQRALVQITSQIRQRHVSLVTLVTMVTFINARNFRLRPFLQFLPPSPPSGVPTGLGSFPPFSGWIESTDRFRNSPSQFSRVAPCDEHGVGRHPVGEGNLECRAGCDLVGRRAIVFKSWRVDPVGGVLDGTNVGSYL